jgi:hypothetical protein
MIPEKINVSDSLLFMLSCREALAGIVESSSMPMTERGRTTDFLYNEATDYQIMSLIIRGELPEDKYNIYGEQLLHTELKEQIIQVYEFVSDQFGDEVILSLLAEVGPLYPKYSSAAPVLEFLLSTRNQVVSEAVPEAIGAGAEKVSAVWNAFKNIPVVKAVAADLKVDPNNMKRGSEVDRLILRQLEKAKGNVDAAVQGLKGKFSKGWLQSKLERANKGRGSQYRAPEETWDKIRIWAQHKSLDAKSAVNSALQKAQQQAGKIDAAQPGAKYVAGAALAALAIFGAYKTYKRFFSKSAKACSGNKGVERKACIKKFKVDAIKAQISDLNAASAKCAATKDPGKCKATIGAKIQKLQTKAQKSAA